MDDLGEISRTKDFVEQEGMFALDDRKADAIKSATRRHVHWNNNFQMYKINKNDIAVMKGIAQSGALSIQREVGGLYNPKESFKPCNNLPSTPEEYESTEGLYKCGLSDLVIGSEDEVTIMWPWDLIQESFQHQLFMWHTHPDSPNLMHLPPSTMDFEVTVNACRDMRIDLDQLVVSRLGLWRLHVRYMDLFQVSEEDVQNAIYNFNFYAELIQSEEEVEKRNKLVDIEYRQERMSPEEFVKLMSRNIGWCTVEFHSFE